MATVTIDDPDEHDTKKVDDRGRVYVGNAYAGKRVTIVVEVMSE